MHAIGEQAKKLAIQIIQNEARADQLAWYNRSLNIDHDRQVCFVHNPKAMGTSMKAWLGLRTDNADHRFPTLMVNKDLWERYTTVVVVRHPVERFLSSYQFHCRSDYAGGYLTKYPDLKSWQMETYFERMTAHDPYTLAHQWKYAVHLRSEHPVDVLIKMGEHAVGLEDLAARVGLSEPFPQRNRATGEKPALDAAFRARLTDYYRPDFEMFGFEP